MRNLDPARPHGCRAESVPTRLKVNLDLPPVLREAGQAHQALDALLVPRLVVAQHIVPLEPVDAAARGALPGLTRAAQALIQGQARIKDEMEYVALLRGDRVDLRP